jgi:hypothetical protein
MNLVSAVQSENKLVDVAGIEPATPCLQSKRKFNLSRCFGCAYQFEAPLGCSKVAKTGSFTISERFGENSLEKC